MKKIIITGSQGIIGKILTKKLNSQFHIYEIDITDRNHNKNYFQADISNLKSLSSVFKKIGKSDLLIHLAASSAPNAKWEYVLKNNIIGIKNIYECARIFGIKKVVFASSSHITAGYEKDALNKKNQKLVSIHDPIRPNSDYGSSKAFGEAIARQYFELYKIKSICLRIGAVLSDDNPTKDKTGRNLKIWLSHRDLLQLIKKALFSNIKFGIYYGVSNNKWKFWNISNAKKELNYQPTDNASLFLKYNQG
ncbi:NAD(P)-dependent oxidoreductase [Candidatus Parcubacteria bacterium]|nr:NAD(P)-dependent oxidoreductase [Candidatus Parcubacteria bacterium]